MADQGSNEGSTSDNVSAESSDSTLQLNIKTLDSHIYSFEVDRNMSVSSFKEKIANETGVPTSRQRLIFRGKVLKDEHLLLEYHLENGHTLHLVERQPNQSQVSGTSSAEPTVTNVNQGNDAGSGVPRNRVGTISHSVVLGTINMEEQGDSMVPDLNRVIGAVLNSIGIGGQNRSSVSNATQTSASSGSETEGIHAGNWNLAGNQAQSGQTFHGQAFQSLPQVVQIPVPAGAIPIPSLNAPIPHSLNTLSEFINSMEHTLSQNGHRPNLSSTNPRDQQLELPTNAQGLPTIEALSTVVHHTEQLLSDHVVAALSHIAGRLDRDGTSSDLSIRGQIQSESVQTGLAMQHLGALLLELGRTMLTLRMGQSYAESAVNAGPAVYISPSGPNPIMVQPFPLQTSSLFSGPVPSTPPTSGAVGIGSVPRNVNIHIHAGTSLAPIISSIGSRPNNGEGIGGELHSEPGSGVGVASSTQTGFGLSTSQPPSDPTPLSSSVLDEINSRLNNILGDMQGDITDLSGLESTGPHLPASSESRPAPGNEQLGTMDVNGFGVSSVGCTSESGVQKPQSEAVQTCCSDERDDSVDKFVSDQVSSRGETITKSEKVQGAPSVSEEQDATEPAKAAPLGLGMSGLERKKRSRPQPPAGKGAGGEPSSSSANQSQQTRTDGQQILQALASHGSALNLRNPNGPSQQPLPSGDNQIDMAGLMSQVLHSPAMNGLLSGVSQQTRVDSPDGLRNMLQQFTQNPQMMNTVNEIAEQVGGEDIGNMFAGMERGQGGGIDLSRMFQQMMPVVSRVLGGGSPPPLFSAAEPQPQASHRDENSYNRSLQLDLQPVVERIERLSPPMDVFRAVAENAIHVSGNGSASNDLLDELCSNESLVGEYVKMLRNDVKQRYKGHSELDKS
ncbi:PREDICTED: large proline-rich protein BAG6-like isoform X1 [Lupinus angustifolius]|uniref:large proline-rich protein BAG6-like isoform X1 n=1 Tax=Lupinus angustifolius TaxID=3871 RepID=UPI00092F4E12|nr:PREDICTED: large proline-rich protein BAG6-like isoform X1 [Lupinus angustifolius]